MDMTDSMYLEHELKKILGSTYPDATYVGRSCFIDLGSLNKARIHFGVSLITNEYDMLKVTILNRKEGVIDKMNLLFSDILGCKKVNNPNFPDGVWPHIWVYEDKIDWYAYHPNDSDYRALNDAVATYLSVFQEPNMDSAQQWTPSM